MIAVVCKFLLHDRNTIDVDLALPSKQVNKIVESCLIVRPSQLCEIVNSLLTILIFLSHYIISTLDPGLKKVSFFQFPTITLTFPTCLSLLLAKTVAFRLTSKKFITFLGTDLLFYY